MSELVDQRSGTPADANEQLFAARRQLRCELAVLEADPASDRVRIRALRRRLDQLTTEIVQCNIGLVRAYAGKFTGLATVTDREEFEAAGVLGLMHAVESYDPQSGGFGQWAFKPIQREVLRAVRDVDHPNLTFGDFEKRPAILRAHRQLRGPDESHSPTDAEVAAAACVSVAQVRRVLVPPSIESLSGAEGDRDRLADTVSSSDPAIDASVVSAITIDAVRRIGLCALDERESYVVVRRFGLDDAPVGTLAEIGGVLGITGESVRQIEAKALAKLQHPLVLRKLTSAA